MKNKYIENEKLSIFLFLAIFVVYGLVYMTKNCFSAAMVLLVDEGILTKTQTGSIMAVFYLVYAVFQVPGGFLADRFSPYPLVAIGLVGGVLSNLLILFAKDYYTMMIIWGFNAMIQFGIWPGFFKIASRHLSPAHRKNAVFYIAMASTIGLVFSYVTAGAVTSWRGNFVVSTTVLAVCTVAWLVITGFVGRHLVEEKSDVERSVSAPKAEERSVPGSDMFSVLIKSGLVIMCPSIILKSVFSAGVQGVVPSMLTESYESISPSIASVLNVFPLVVSVLGKFIMQGFYRKKRRNESLAMASGMLCMLVPLTVMSFVGRINVWVIVIMVSLVLIIASAVSTVSVSYIPVRFDKVGRTGTVAGIINAMAALGIVVSNYISPLLADAFGGWREVVFAWIAFAVVCILVLFASWIPWKKYIKKSQ